MPSKVIRFPTKLGPRPDRRRAGFRSLANGPSCPVVALSSRAPMLSPLTAYQYYLQASKIDGFDDTQSQATLDRARSLYSLAIQLDPRLDIAYTNLGNMYFHHDKNEAEAEKLYLQALTISPEQPEANYNLGYLRLNNAQPHLAIPLFQKSLEADTSFGDAHFNLAFAYKDVGNTLGSIRHFKAYLRLEPVGMWADVARGHLRDIA